MSGNALSTSACYVARVHATWDKARFGQLLRGIMDDTGLMALDVAHLAGISRPQVSRWLQGEHRPNFDALQQFTAALRMQYPWMSEGAAGLMAAAGYPDATGPSVELDDGTYSVTGLSEEELPAVMAFLQGFRAKKIAVSQPAQAARALGASAAGSVPSPRDPATTAPRPRSPEPSGQASP